MDDFSLTPFWIETYESVILAAKRANAEGLGVARVRGPAYKDPYNLYSLILQSHGVCTWRIVDSRRVWLLHNCTINCIRTQKIYKNSDSVSHISKFKVNSIFTFLRLSKNRESLISQKIFLLSYIFRDAIFKKIHDKKIIYYLSSYILNYDRIFSHFTRIKSMLVLTPVIIVIYKRAFSFFIYGSGTQYRCV